MLEVISTRRSAVRIAALLGATSIAFTSAAEMSTEEMRSLMEGVYSLQEWRQDGKVLTPPTVDGRTVHIDGSIVFIIHRGEGDEKLTVAQFGNYTGLPFFAPELFQTVELANPMKSKQLQAGLMQLGEEGAIQVFRPHEGGAMLLGAVGQLQFEVVQHRLKSEYSVDVRMMPSRFVGARWITADTPDELRKFTDANASKLALDAADTLAYLMTSPYDLRLTQERFPKIHFHPLREHAGLTLQKAA